MAERDAALVRAAQAGDKAAFARVFTRHLPLLRALCQRTLGDPWLVEDAIQESALQALLGIGRLRQPERFGPWLGGIGLNICRRWLRERSRVAWSWESLAGGRAAAETADPGDGTEAVLEAVELRNAVRRAVVTLPDGQRQAVVLFYLSGLTYAETAALLGIEVGAVKTRLHKARAKLSRQLADGRMEDTMDEKLDRRTLTKAAGAAAASAALGHEAPAAGAEVHKAPTPDEGEFVEMRVVDVRRRFKGDDAPPAYVVVLAEIGGGRRLPIWVGEPEGTAIALHLEGVETPRPMTFAFLASALAATGGRLREVQIDRLAETVFYATAVIEGPNGAQRVDARPSDALNLALLTGAPVRVASAVLDAVTDSPATTDEANGKEGDGPAEIVAGVKAMWAQTATGVQREEE